MSARIYALVARANSASRAAPAISCATSKDGTSPSGFGHPSCQGGLPSDGIIKELSQKFPTKPRH